MLSKIAAFNDVKQMSPEDFNDLCKSVVQIADSRGVGEREPYISAWVNIPRSGKNAGSLTFGDDGACEHFVIDAQHYLRFDGDRQLEVTAKLVGPYQYVTSLVFANDEDNGPDCEGLLDAMLAFTDRLE